MVPRKSYHKLQIGNYEYGLDGYFKDNMDIILNEAIPNKWDALFILHGKEGAGKTTLATQMCLYLDPKFNLDYVVYTPEQFLKVLETAPDESAILWDESITGAMGQKWANELSIAIISKLTQIRKKRMKLVLCFPYLYMLNKYFVARCIASVYVYANGFKDRGHAYYYTQDQTEYLYGYMKEICRLYPKKAYTVCKKAFFFRFIKTFCLPEEEYEDKKDKNRLGVTAKVNHWKLKFLKSLALHKEMKQIPALADRLKCSTNYLYMTGKEVIEKG